MTCKQQVFKQVECFYILQQASTLFLTVGKVYNLDLQEKNKRKTEFYVKVYILPDR